MAPDPDPAPRRGYHHGNLREALLDAALDLVAERGPQGFTLSEAARRAGVSPAAPYRHFKDREEVLAALRLEGIARFGRRLQAAAAEASGPTEAVAGLGPAYLAFAREEPGHYAAIFAAPPDSSEASPFESMVQAIAEVLPSDWPDPRLVALQIWALSHGVAMLERVGLPPDAGAPAERILDTGVAALLGRPG